MSEVEKTIEKTIEKYVQGYLGANPEWVEEAFHSETRLQSVDEGKLDSLEMGDWLKNLNQRREKKDIREARAEIGFIDVSSDTAVAKVFLHFQNNTFVDYLSLLKLGEQWKVVAKIYSVQSLN